MGSHGKDSDNSARSLPLIAIERVGRGLFAIVRAAGVGVTVVWRVAGALDAALWRGVVRACSGIWAGITFLGRIVARGAGDFLGWLPTRAGRAYSAFSAAVLIIAGLWIVDELRVAPQHSTAVGAERRPPVDAADPILARIDGRYVHLSDVEAAARASGALQDGERLTPATAFSRNLVESYVEQRLLARAAMDEALHRDPYTARRIAAARERILAAAYMESRLAAAVTDAQIERFYRAQSDVTRLGDEVRARHILVATGEEAEAIVEAITAGAEFGALARERSLDRSTAALGGDLGWFTQDMMMPVLSATAFATPAGQLAAPFQTEFGWHVLEVTDRRRTEGVPLAAVKDNVRRFLTMRTIERTLAQLKEENDVVYYSSSISADSDRSGGGGAPAQRAQ